MPEKRIFTRQLIKSLQADFRELEQVVPAVLTTDCYESAKMSLAMAQCAKKELFATWIATPEELARIDWDNIHISVGYVNDNTAEEEQLDGKSFTGDPMTHVVIVPTTEELYGDGGEEGRVCVGFNQLYEVTLVAPFDESSYELDEGDTFWFSPCCDEISSESTAWGLRDIL